jgi:flagellar biosynthesis GTPase FlhF
LRIRASVANIAPTHEDIWNHVKALESWEQRGFVITLLVIAFVINGVRYAVPARQISYQPSVPATYAPVIQSQVVSAQADAKRQELEQEQKAAEAQAAADNAAAARLAMEAKARQDEADRQAAAAAQAAEKAAARHANDLARYLSGTLSRKAETKSVAVAASTEDGKSDSRLDEALASRFRSDSVDTMPAFFAPEFVSDGLLADTFGGSRDSLARLDLLDSLDGIVLAKETVEYSQDPSLDNVISAHLHADIMSMPVATRGERQTWSLTANGSGFRRDDARIMAEDRLLKQIAADTNMSLNLN